MKTKFLLVAFLLFPLLNHAGVYLYFDYEYDVFSHGKPLNIKIEGITTYMWMTPEGPSITEIKVSSQIVLNPGERNAIGLDGNSFDELKFFIQDPFNLNHWSEIDALTDGKYYFSGKSRIDLNRQIISSNTYLFKLKFEMPRVIFKGSHVNPSDVNVYWRASDMSSRKQINSPNNPMPDNYDCILKANQTDIAYWNTSYEITRLWYHYFHIEIQGETYKFFTYDLLQEGAIYLNNYWYIKFDPTDSDVDNFYYSYIIGYGNRARIMQQELELPEAATPVTIYPNPATDHINIGYDLEQNTELTIYSMDGKIMERVLLDSELNTIRVETPHYKSGMYMFRYGNETGKFIIK